MDEFELINASDCSPVIEEDKNALQLISYYLCWYCNEGTNKGKLISPCNDGCFRKFMHVHCLEMLANTQKILNCQSCNSPYPLEERCKSLLECYRDRNLRMLLKDQGPVMLNLYSLMFYCILFIISIVRLIIVYSMRGDVWHFIIIIITCLYIFVYSILKTLHTINFWFWRLHYVEHQLHIKSREFKLIKQYENDCIQETEV